MTGKTMMKMCKSKAQNLVGQLFAITVTEENTPPPPMIHQILQEYQDVFSEPTSLPPPRSFDDHITLKPNFEPPNQRPYRYPFVQKSEIERLIKEMLSAGISQPSHSPFASPVILVKKKYGTWRFCVDYRRLNEGTLKDKYPIPLIEVLLDELDGASVFSKIDLRSGYHQVRVHATDVHKTAFRTHVGHFEFKVMPFGLTNAPATFQSLMNEIFQPYLRQLVLVFFDDILVYSSSMELHYQHLSKVFELLRQRKLFAKESKCIFSQQKIEYLGHIIRKKEYMRISIR